MREYAGVQEVLMQIVCGVGMMEEACVRTIYVGYLGLSRFDYFTEI